jgi:hypothetical protein
MEGASEQLFVVMSFTNVGRRPIHLTGWGGKYRERVNNRDSFVIVPIALPRTLNEGETHSEYTNELPAAIGNVKRLSVWDASDNHWYLSRSGMKGLKKEYRKFVVAAQHNG